MSSLNYRPEIDGLRAIAVTSVILYHAELLLWGHDWFKGGYIGVDIFFVISGYLISKIIMSELRDKDKFNFLNFYERRARRIMPMLLTVMLVSLPFAWRYLLPDDFVEYSESILYSLIFISNFFFHSATIEYGADSSLLKPFLHTWSLSIEEQFYIFCPPMLILLHRKLRAYTLTIIAAALLISLQYAEIMSSKDADMNFFYPTTRFWELLAGTMLAYLDLKYGRRLPHILHMILPIFGIYLIVHSILFFDGNTAHPGFRTIVPIIGIAFVIYFSNPEELVGRILGSKPFVAIGLVSYSAYLWHFPIFAFGRMQVNTPDNADKIQWVIITFILSVLSYYLIEQPFRNRKKIKTKHLLWGLAIVTLGVVGFHLYSVQKNGFPERVSMILQNLETKPYTQEKLTEKFKKSGKIKNVIILGDSHMGAILPNLRDRVKFNKYKFMNLKEGACWPIENTQRYSSKTNEPDKVCSLEYQNERMEKIKSAKKSIVVIGGRLPVYLSGKFFDNTEGGIETTKPWESYLKPKDSNLSVSEAAVQTIEKILDAGHHIVLVYPIPEVGWNVPKKLLADRPGTPAEFLKHLKENPITTDYSVYKKRSKQSRALLDSIKHKNIHRVYPNRLFCNKQIKGRCVTHDTEHAFYRDDDHPSYRGAEMINDLIIKEIIRIERSLLKK